MNDEIVSSLARLKRRRQIWEKWDEEDRAFEQNYEQREDKIIYKRKVYERVIRIAAGTNSFNAICLI